MAPLEQREGKRADHRDTPSAGIREIFLTQKLSHACPGMEESWPVIFSELQKKCSTPKGIYFPDLYSEVDGMVDYMCSSCRKQSDSSLTQCICTLVSGG